ncbi:MAG: LacI family DNA-binding transcriptional regulator [Spirochaetes bacterium]|nr:LacI family DNA-binding transcriptional regulator [Spirochaetota bacterium]
MNIRLKDIAAKCGVSINTVSHILNRNRGDLYDPKLVAKVKRIAGSMDYKPSRAAQSLVLKRSRIVGFIVMSEPADGQVQHYNEYPFLLGMSHELYHHNYHTMLVEVNELGYETELPPILRDRIFDGLVVHAGFSKRLQAQLEKIDVPIIFWDCGIFGKHDSIDRGEYETAALVIRELMALGHTRITFHAGSDTAWNRYTTKGDAHFSYSARYEAYRDTISKSGTPHVISGYDAAMIAGELIKNGSTAVVTLGESILPRIILAAGMNGWTIPRDFSIATFDHSERISAGAALMVGGAPYDRYAAGIHAGTMILSKITSDGSPIPSVVIPGAFDTGETIAAPRS